MRSRTKYTLCTIAAALAVLAAAAVALYVHGNRVAAQLEKEVAEQARSADAIGAAPNTMGVGAGGARSASDTACRDKLRARGVYLGNTDQCIDIDDVIKKLDTGTYRFNKPEIAYVDEPFRLVLTLETAPGQDITTAFRGTEGKIVERPAPFAQHLQATLRGGPDFQVDPSGAQERTVTSSAPVVWDWTVNPRSSGKKSIVIDVDADIILPGRKEHVLLRTLNEEIQINVGVFHLVAAAFASLWGYALGLATMIIALLSIHHYWSARKKPEPGEAESDEPPPVELVTHHLSESPHE